MQVSSCACTTLLFCAYRTLEYESRMKDYWHLLQNPSKEKLKEMKVQSLLCFSVGLRLWKVLSLVSAKLVVLHVKLMVALAHTYVYEFPPCV